MATTSSTTPHACDLKAKCDPGCKCNCAKCLVVRDKAGDETTVAARVSAEAHPCAFRTGHLANPKGDPKAEDTCTCNCAPCLEARGLRQPVVSADDQGEPLTTGRKRDGK